MRRLYTKHDVILIAYTSIKINVPYALDLTVSAGRSAGYVAAFIASFSS